MADDALSAEIRALGKKIVGQAADETLQSLGAQIAAAQIDLIRIRRASMALYEKALKGGEEVPERNSAAESPADWATITAQLLILDRYERRAISRRKRAIRALNLARYDRFLQKDRKFEAEQVYE